MAKAVDDARRELRERLDTFAFDNEGRQSWTAQRTRTLLAQLEAASVVLQARLVGAWEDAEKRTQDKALADLIEQIGVGVPPTRRSCSDDTSLTSWPALNAHRGLRLHHHSVRRYGLQMVEDMQRSLVQSALQGESYSQARDRLTGRSKGVMALSKHRASTIVRMENNSTYNQLHLEGLKEASNFLDEPGRPDPMQRRADEFLDARSHPMSFVLHGLVVDLDEPWRVSHAEVAAKAAQLKRGMRGIVWPLRAGEYVGMTYPAHFGERGRQTAWRSSWADT